MGTEQQLAALFIFSPPVTPYLLGGILLNSLADKSTCRLNALHLLLRLVITCQLNGPTAAGQYCTAVASVCHCQCASPHHRSDSSGAGCVISERWRLYAAATTRAAACTLTAAVTRLAPGGAPLPLLLLLLLQLLPPIVLVYAHEGIHQAGTDVARKVQARRHGLDNVPGGKACSGRAAVAIKHSIQTRWSCIVPAGR